MRHYRGMYNWTNNNPDGSLQIFTQVIQYFNNTYPSRTLPYKIRPITQIIIQNII